MIFRRDFPMIREISTLFFLVFQHCFFVTICVFKLNPKKPTFITTQNHDFDMWHTTVPGTVLVLASCVLWMVYVAARWYTTVHCHTLRLDMLLLQIVKKYVLSGRVVVFDRKECRNALLK